MRETFLLDPIKIVEVIQPEIAAFVQTVCVEKQDADAKNNAALAAQQAATNRTQALQTRYGELQTQEDDLLRQIGQAKQPGPEYRQGKSVRHQPNPQKSQLPLFQSHLSEVRHEKAEVKKQLQKAQD